MIQTIAGFESAWAFESAATLRLLNNLSTESLRQRVANDHRTLGMLAWHLVVTIPEMMNRAGLGVSGPAEDAPLPGRGADIADAYRDTAASLAERVRSKWSDAELQVEDEMYGEKWKRGQTLRILMDHQIHHRGQMTVLMRQAGLAVPGIYGPSRDEWSAMGMEPPPND